MTQPGSFRPTRPQNMTEQGLLRRGRLDRYLKAKQDRMQESTSRSFSIRYVDDRLHRWLLHLVQYAVERPTCLTKRAEAPRTRCSRNR